MRSFAPALAAAASLFLLSAPAPASASPPEKIVSTDISSQLRVETGRGGFRVGIDRPGRRWDRYHQRRYDDRRRYRYRDRVDGRRCSVRRVTRYVDGERVTRVIRRCR